MFKKTVLTLAALMGFLAPTQAAWGWGRCAKPTL